MSFNFVIPEFNIGGNGTPTLQFFRRGFNLTSNGVIFNFTTDGNPIYIKTNDKCSLSIL